MTESRVATGLKIVAIVVFAIIVFFQFLAIFSEYVQYRVTSVTYERKPLTVMAPMVSVCAESAELIDGTKLTEELAAKWPELRDKFKSRSDFVYEASAELSSQAVMAIDAATPAEVFTKVEVRSSNDTSTMVQLEGGVTIYYRGLMKCFTFDIPSSGLRSDMMASMYGKNKGVYLNLEMKADLAKIAKWRLYLHRDKMVLGMKGDDYIDLDLSKTKYVSVKYSVREHRHLSEPYESACSSYEHLGFSSSGQWQDFCFTDHFKANGSVPGFVYQSAQGNLTVMADKVLDTNPELRASFMDIAETYCRIRNSDCRETMFSLQEMDRERSEEDTDTVIKVYLPTEPDRVTYEHPDMVMSEAMARMGKIILWWALVVLVIRACLKRKRQE
ncbi:hypothetical protein HDE_05780 [Halotydeus destructor]|nr:hypothetical protein HDE_05780 [Halotydeus destructor]